MRNAQFFEAPTIRIREAQNHGYPDSDPDPQHSFQAFFFKILSISQNQYRMKITNVNTQILTLDRFCMSFLPKLRTGPRTSTPAPPPLEVSLVFSPLSPFPLYFRTILITQNFPPIYIYRSVGRTGVGKALARIGRVAPVSPTPLLPAPRPRYFVCERHLSSR